MGHELSKLANEIQATNEPLSEPHFDDEATLLSARRVVPFHKLTDKTNSKRALFFGATLAAALVMGVIGGVIYARLEGTPGTKTETRVQAAQPALQDEFDSSSVQSDEVANAPDESMAPAVDNRDQKTADKTRNSSTNAKKKASLSPSARRVQTEPDELEYYANEREIRRAERRAARRARSKAARESQRSDDLFRIREIFEGSSRP